MGQLGSHSRLATTLQTDEHDDGGGVLGEIGRAVVAPQQGDEFAVDDFD